MKNLKLMWQELKQNRLMQITYLLVLVQVILTAILTFR